MAMGMFIPILMVIILFMNITMPMAMKMCIGLVRTISIIKAMFKVITFAIYR